MWIWTLGVAKRGRRLSRRTAADAGASGGSAMIKGRFIVVFLALSILIAPPGAMAQGTSPARVGVLVTALGGQIEALRQGMRELGWVEGQNVLFEIRSADGRAERLNALAAALVASKADVIFTGDIAAASAAHKATATIPHVGASLGDAVAQGFAKSFARPDGNVTGLSLQGEELTGKWFQLLKEALPALSRVAIFHHARPAGIPAEKYEATARALGLEPRALTIHGASDLKQAFDAARRWRAQALVISTSPLFGQHAHELAALALKNRLPTMAFGTEFPEAGGLMSYGPRITDNFHRAATYIDRILKGGRAGEMPIERPTRFYLGINLKTAKALGLTIPQSLLLRADQVIE
jgi:putative ABC transport system substrate-binding protein